MVSIINSNNDLYFFNTFNHLVSIDYLEIKVFVKSILVNFIYFNF